MIISFSDEPNETWTASLELKAEGVEVLTIGTSPVPYRHGHSIDCPDWVVPELGHMVDEDQNTVLVYNHIQKSYSAFGARRSLLISAMDPETAKVIIPIGETSE